MRTTIDINDELFRRLKRRAADERTTVRAVVEGALRALLEPRARARQTYALTWRTERGRLQPGVDLDDRNTLIDLMEGRR
ncbi:MAG: type II toxin-antitoxin system VapB family antitoxin [Deltaproteobacteria bacterium]|nr:type II toxin-antitoxin system VapB family antitoxin [Deltaproteobacteria bacterium]